MRKNKKPKKKKKTIDIEKVLLNNVRILIT